jgi:lysophospholipid acyltransferase
MLIGFAEPSNVDILACELATTPSGYIAGWNTSVQAWLKDCVYRRLPRGMPRPAKQLAVFAVSAFWHGVHPGYYLCFLGMFAMVVVEQAVRALAVRPGETHSYASWLASHLWTMLCFSFVGGAFNLLRLEDTLALWHSLRFYGLYLIPLPALLAAALGALRLGARRSARRRVKTRKELKIEFSRHASSYENSRLFSEDESEAWSEEEQAEDARYQFWYSR